jgi:hypothetical protein
MNTGLRTISFFLLITFCLTSTLHFFSGNYGICLPDGGNIKDQFFPRGANVMQEISRYRYIGAQSCASTCHNSDSLGFQYDIWLKNPHSEAYKILSSRRAQSIARHSSLNIDPQEDDQCLRCHITGAGLDSSYFSSTYKREDGVTCEACHKRTEDGKTFIPAETDCRECHDGSAHDMKRFIFTEAIEKIAHPRPLKLK